MALPVPFVSDLPSSSSWICPFHLFPTQIYKCTESPVCDYRPVGYGSAIIFFFVALSVPFGFPSFPSVRVSAQRALCFISVVSPRHRVTGSPKSSCRAESGTALGKSLLKLSWTGLGGKSKQLLFDDMCTSAKPGLRYHWRGCLRLVTFGFTSAWVFCFVLFLLTASFGDFRRLVDIVDHTDLHCWKREERCGGS